VSASEEELALERDIFAVGDAAGYWLFYDNGHWLRKRSFIDVPPGTSVETVYQFWVWDVRDDLRIASPGLPAVHQAQFLALIHGDKPELSHEYVSRADLRPDEYPEVPEDYDYYTVIYSLVGESGHMERYMEELEADSWVEAERFVLRHYLNQGLEAGKDIMIGGTIRGGPGCYEPASMVCVTHNGLPPS
jgi:hypothetical protein